MLTEECQYNPASRTPEVGVATALHENTQGWQDNSEDELENVGTTGLLVYGYMRSRHDEGSCQAGCSGSIVVGHSTGSRILRKAVHRL